MKSKPTTKFVNKIRKADRKLHRACRQVILLNRQISDLKQRYDRASRGQQRSICCSLHLRMVTYEGVRNMVYEYVSQCYDEVKHMQAVLQMHVDAGNQDSQTNADHTDE